MSISHKHFWNRRNIRILAIGMLAFPEPVITTVLALSLMGVSFLLPDVESNMGRACTCGCDYHRCPTHAPEKHHMGTGALVHNRRLLSPNAFHTEAVRVTDRYGFLLALPPGIPADTLYSTNKAKQECNSYRLQGIPAMEGSLLKRQTGYGSKAAVRWEQDRSPTTR